MILQATKQLEIETIGEMEQGLTAGISEESMPFVFELVSKQLYSNPIGSIVREITSNCLDAHTEAENTEDPVIVRFKNDPDEGMIIEFQDFGVGISPNRIQEIYMNYFSSTKRADNSLIGGFGLTSN